MEDKTDPFKTEVKNILREAKKRGIDVDALVQEVSGTSTRFANGIKKCAACQNSYDGGKFDTCPYCLRAVRQQANFFKKMGATGGKAASKNMSAKERSDRALKAALARHGKPGK